MASEEDDPSSHGASPPISSTSDEVIAPSRLLSLPIEIREIILDMVLGDYKCITVGLASGVVPKGRLRPWVHLRLSCKQVDAEITSLLCSRHQFFEVEVPEVSAYSDLRLIGSFINRPPWSGTLIGVIKYSTCLVRRARSKESVDHAISDQELRETAENARQRLIKLGQATFLNDGTWSVSAVITSEHAPRNVFLQPDTIEKLLCMGKPWLKRWGLEIRIEASAANN